MPTIVERGLNEGGYPLFGDMQRDDFRRSYAKMLELIAKLHEAKVPIVGGTDGWGLELVREIEIYEHAGLSKAAAVQTVTINTARRVGIDDRTGSIRVGKEADMVPVNSDAAYPIGTPGVPWGDSEKKQWFAAQSVKRSYAGQVLDKLEPLKARFEVVNYGALSIAPERYPLFAVHVGAQRAGCPTVLITGGVHGYETSGMQGALRFLATQAERCAEEFSLVVAPCISPWGYETINRWNPLALDPNRSFVPEPRAEEAAALTAYLDSLSLDFVLHMDLHETTDTDNSEFRPALGARDGQLHDRWHIPDGFYTVGDSRKPTPEFQRAIIESVSAVTHIAPSDASGDITDERAEQPGVIHHESAALGLCMGMTDARFVATTEVYPDSPKANDEICNAAQVAAVMGGLNYLRSIAK